LIADQATGNVWGEHWSAVEIERTLTAERMQKQDRS
jgi:hypothetical protein